MKRPPHVAIRIERIVVDAAGIRPREAPLIQAALEAELARLLSPPQVSISGGAIRSASATNPNIGSAASAEVVGQEIARSVHALVTGTR